MDGQMVIYIIAITFLGPVLGSLIGVIRKPSESMMVNLLSFAAGVMLGVSFLQLIPEAIALSSIEYCMAGILLGAVFMYVVDKAIPHIHPGLCTQEQGGSLKRTVGYLLIGIFLHNFPEGMAIGVGLVNGADYSLSLAIALAIAIHDIPESICTAAPYFFLTGKRLKAFLVSSFTSVATVVGFLFTFVLFNNIPLSVVGLLVAATAGLMIYISADELIPTSCRCEGHGAIFSLITGVLLVVLLGAFQ